ncbi:MAG TPA: endonuclease/exonuclease/phosphatase family protein [Gemmatimonadales bacterium]|nr:endonuclease/exonuclease/phosphatase family protein [Gemmatimonadales bacterium]
MQRLIAPILGAALAAACTRDVLSPASTAFFGRTPPAEAARSLTVVTRNVYLGADLDPLIAAPPELVPVLAAQKFAEIQATNFAERAGALADEIAAATPHVVGLQEVELYRVQSPGDAAFGGNTPAATVAIDFLQLLTDAIAARGLDYVVAVVQENLDAEVPALTGIGPGGPQFDDIRLTDRDVILVRGDVDFAAPRGANFTVNLPVTIGGRAVFILRGWTSVRLEVAGHRFDVFNAHLETQVAPPVQEAQARELLAIAAADPLPDILLGDFNSDASGTQTATYAILTGAGFRDAWLEVHPAGDGLTCCQAPDLRNPESQLDQRIDLVLVGPGWKVRNGSLVGGVHAAVVGDEPEDRTPSGLWPSDHAGVVATLTLPPQVAQR